MHIRNLKLIHRLQRYNRWKIECIFGSVSCTLDAFCAIAVPYFLAIFLNGGYYQQIIIFREGVSKFVISHCSRQKLYYWRSSFIGVYLSNNKLVEMEFIFRCTIHIYIRKGVTFHLDLEVHWTELFAPHQSERYRNLK